MNREAWQATVHEVAKESDMTATVRLGEIFHYIFFTYYFDKKKKYKVLGMIYQMYLRNTSNKISFFEKNYLFLTVLGLCCFAWVFSSCGNQGLLFVAVLGLLVVVASLVAEHRL